MTNARADQGASPLGDWLAFGLHAGRDARPRAGRRARPCPCRRNSGWGKPPARPARTRACAGDDRCALAEFCRGHSRPLHAGRAFHCGRRCWVWARAWPVWQQWEAGLTCSGGTAKRPARLPAGHALTIIKPLWPAGCSWQEAPPPPWAGSRCFSCLPSANRVATRSRDWRCRRVSNVATPPRCPRW